MWKRFASRTSHVRGCLGGLARWEDCYWVAVKELELRDYPPIMENQMEKKMENDMDTGGI